MACIDKDLENKMLENPLEKLFTPSYEGDK